MKGHRLCLGILASAVCTIVPSQVVKSATVTSDFSFTGTFATDDTVQLFDFTVAATSTVTVQTFSFGGGIQADGNVVSAGGFDTILSLFDGNGNFILSNDDGSLASVDPVTGSAFDSSFTTTLGPGDFTVAITQFDNFFSGGIGDNISTGFDVVGDPDFTGTDFGCSNGQFCSVGGDNRTNEFALDILGVESASAAAVPEPFTILGTAVAALAGGYSKFKKQSIDSE